MQFLNFILIGISLAMDAFAVCVCQGMSNEGNKETLGIKLGVTFGMFQGIMPWVGYKIGNIFSDRVSVYGGIIACIILVLIGCNMIREAKEEEECTLITGIKTLLMLGVATSIDALIVGFSFAFENVEHIYFGICLIAGVTFIISFVGTTVGYKIKEIIGKKAQYLGGIVLIILGIKALVENF